ncbi:MmyB family transcriptional regulator [Streptomyces cyaneofuscatus]|uniref:helix-turn-helix domain-containing protein n=1 Tax=Streptomyces cyaneofuscatus TaxID=66883 RepID=UPI0037D9A999
MMAQELGISEHYYRRLETGRRPMSSDTIAEVSRLLTLHPDEQLALYRWAGRPVPPLLSPITPEVPDDIRDHIDRLPYPALLEGPDFGIIAYNRRAARACPWAARPGANVMTDLLLPGPGRDQCAQWEEHWAPPLLAQLRQGASGSSQTRSTIARSALFPPPPPPPREAAPQLPPPAPHLSVFTAIYPIRSLYAFICCG